MKRENGLEMANGLRSRLSSSSFYLSPAPRDKSMNSLRYAMEGLKVFCIVALITFGAIKWVPWDEWPFNSHARPSIAISGEAR